MRDVFVPAHRVTTLLRTAGEAPAPLAEPIERYPVFGLLAVGIAAVSLGIARCAIDALIELAGGKTPQGATRPLAQRAATQERTAQAEARLAAARAGLLMAVDAAWREALSGEITLRTDEGGTLLTPGMCAGFKAGVPNGHCLVNLSAAPASYLEIGTRSMTETARYTHTDRQPGQGAMALQAAANISSKPGG